MASTMSVGDWVVAGGRDDLDMGTIQSIDHDRDEMMVGWQSGVSTSCPISADDVEVYGTRAAAEARYKERLAADPPNVGRTRG